MMNSRPLISVIIPIYNMSEYLDRCIESVVNQTYRDLEILLVDDGSTDNSLELCHQYATIDSRINVMHKHNGGQGSARNVGLGLAHGEYIGFVDPDDWIAPDMYDYMYGLSAETSADIVQIGWITTTSENAAITLPNGTPIRKNYSNREAVFELSKNAATLLNTSVCSKLFRKDKLQELRFSEVRAYEDDEFIYKSFWYADKITIDTIPKYYYFVRPNSTMTSRFNLNKLALLTIQRNICDFIQGNIPELYNYHERILCSKQFYILACLFKYASLDPKRKYRDQIATTLHNSYDKYIRNPEMGQNKLMLYILRYTPTWFWSSILKYKFNLN